MCDNNKSVDKKIGRKRGTERNRKFITVIRLYYNILHRRTSDELKSCLFNFLFFLTLLQQECCKSKNCMSNDVIRFYHPSIVIVQHANIKSVRVMVDQFSFFFSLFYSKNTVRAKISWLMMYHPSIKLT